MPFTCPQEALNKNFIPFTRHAPRYIHQTDIFKSQLTYVRIYTAGVTHINSITSDPKQIRLLVYCAVT